MPQETMLRWPDVRARVNLGRSTVERRMAKGEFPKSIPIGGGLVGWLEREINEWIAQCVAAARS